MTVGYYAPLPPAATGVAEYAAALLEELRKSGNVEVAPVTCDLALYHIGNNPLHGAIYERAIAHPGVVVLHDAVLTHFLLGSLSQQDWIGEFVYNYGEWTRGFAQQMWAQRAASASDSRYFAYPMLKRIATTARAVIVHNPAAAEAVRRHAPEARVVEIPHFAPGNWRGNWGPVGGGPSFLVGGEFPHLPETKEVIGEKSGAGWEAAPVFLRIGVFGYLRESKRLPAILRAFDRARHAGAKVDLTIAGSFASVDLERSLGPLLAAPHVSYIGHLSESEFVRAAQSVDVCVNLRYPSAQETSGIGVRLMALGKTVIFTDGPELARIPANACLRVEHGPDEEETLAEYLCWLAANRELAREIGRRAAQHMATEHSLEVAAGLYWEVLNMH